MASVSGLTIDWNLIVAVTMRLRSARQHECHGERTIRIHHLTRSIDDGSGCQREPYEPSASQALHG